LRLKRKRRSRAVAEGSKLIKDKDNKVVGFGEWLREERRHSVNLAGSWYKTEKSSQLVKFVSLGCHGKRQ